MSSPGYAYSHHTHSMYLRGSPTRLAMIIFSPEKSLGLALKWATAPASTASKTDGEVLMSTDTCQAMHPADISLCTINLAGQTQAKEACVEWLGLDDIQHSLEDDSWDNVAISSHCNHMQVCTLPEQFERHNSRFRPSNSTTSCMPAACYTQTLCTPCYRANRHSSTAVYFNACTLLHIATYTNSPHKVKLDGMVVVKACIAAADLEGLPSLG